MTGAEGHMTSSSIYRRVIKQFQIHSDKTLSLQFTVMSLEVFDFRGGCLVFSKVVEQGEAVLSG